MVSQSSNSTNSTFHWVGSSNPIAKADATGIFGRWDQVRHISQQHFCFSLGRRQRRIQVIVRHQKHLACFFQMFHRIEALVRAMKHRLSGKQQELLAVKYEVRFLAYATGDQVRGDGAWEERFHNLCMRREVGCISLQTLQHAVDYCGYVNKTSPGERHLCPSQPGRGAHLLTGWGRRCG